jgi:integrase
MAQRKAQVIDLTRFLGEEESTPRPFGAVRRRKNSTKLYVRFPYFGQIVDEATGLEDTAHNERKLRAFLDRVGETIQAGTFRFDEAFPGANDKKKELFTRLEGREYRLEPQELTFGEYADRWQETMLARDPSANKRRDYQSIIRTHLRPRFGAHTFDGITGPMVVQLVMDLVAQGLSRARISNILIPLRIIYREAGADYQWTLPDPFTYAQHRIRYGRILPQKRKKPPQPFRFAEWMSLVEAMDEWNRPITEVMIMTGMSASELAGLRRGDVLTDRIAVRNKIVNGVESQQLKTAYRVRELPLTAALRERLGVLEARSRGDYLVTRPEGEPFAARVYWTWWKKALKRAGLQARKPYTTRHTFAVWCLVVGVHPTRLVRLMGHGSKQMIYEVYGDYVEGVEKDAEAIRDYLGEDFR